MVLNPKKKEKSGDRAGVSVHGIRKAYNNDIRIYVITISITIVFSGGDSLIVIVKEACSGSHQMREQQNPKACSNTSAGCFCVIYTTMNTA